MNKINACPSCGSRRIRKVRRVVRGEIRGRTYRAADVEFHECPNCGEKVYGREAMGKIEAPRSRARSRRRATARAV